PAAGRNQAANAIASKAEAAPQRRRGGPIGVSCIVLIFGRCTGCFLVFPGPRAAASVAVVVVLVACLDGDPAPAPARTPVGPRRMLPASAATRNALQRAMDYHRVSPAI